MTAGTMNALVMPNSRDHLAGSARGRRRGAATVRQPWYSPTIDQPEPAMWNIGITARFTESGVNRHDSVTFMTPLKKLSFVSITPLGSPVVPDV